MGVAQLRKDLRQWLARAQAGDEVVILVTEDAEQGVRAVLIASHDA